MGDSGQLGNQEEPHDLNRKGLLSQGSNSIAMKSRVNREVQAQFCERLEVRPLRPLDLRLGYSSLFGWALRERLSRKHRVEIVISGAPLAFNVRVRAEIATHHSALLLRHRSANWTFEF
jgi:hypothetical protein